MRDFAMWYFILGILVTIYNGAVRKIEADALLGFAWFLVWPLTPIVAIVSAIARFLVMVYNYQIIRRTRIYLLRKF